LFFLYGRLSLLEIHDWFCLEAALVLSLIVFLHAFKLKRSGVLDLLDVALLLFSAKSNPGNSDLMKLAIFLFHHQFWEHRL
jgi:hypothetical protein